MPKNTSILLLCVACLSLSILACNSAKSGKQHIPTDTLVYRDKTDLNTLVQKDLTSVDDHASVDPLKTDNIDKPKADEAQKTESEAARVADKEIKSLPGITVTESSVSSTRSLSISDGVTPTIAYSASPTYIPSPAKVVKEDMGCYASPIYTEYTSPIGATEGASSHAAEINPALAGQLTAGEINDFQKWKMWEDIAADELKNYRDIWTISPEERFTVVVQNKKGNPAIDARVDLLDHDGAVIWSSRTDNTGKAELWCVMALTGQKSRPDQLRIAHLGEEKKIKHPLNRDQGVNQVKLNSMCDVPEIMELVFTVDATGSMQDEISYLQAELLDVVKNVKSSHPDIKLKIGSVFYRDHGDTYVTKTSDLTEEISVTNQFISNQYADGGGDGPEAVDDALEVSLNEISWSQQARTRIMFLILDAPPHQEEANIQRLLKCIKLASSKGVRIVPLVASGGGYDIDKSLEYLMRCCALATNGTYAFLTDHSGIGGTHTAPTTDKYDVEKLNDLLVRVIEQFAFAPSCDLDDFIASEEPADTAMTSELVQPEMIVVPSDSLTAAIDSTDLMLVPTLFVIKCFPNPASNYVMVQTSELVEEMYLADNAGKIIQKITPDDVITRLDLSGFPSGLYHLKAWVDDRWASVRIVVAHI
jgi:hypothetical protein